MLPAMGLMEVLKCLRKLEVRFEDGHQLKMDGSHFGGISTF
jgi:hypothetical protein